jgi:mono/diheme cytochrome c family protein
VRRFVRKATAVAAVSVGILLETNTGCSRRERSTVNASDTYQKACARCHGDRGQGGAPSSDGPAPRNFTDAGWQKSLTDRQIAETVRAGKGPMPSFDTVLSPEEIAAVTTVVRSFGGGAE